MSNCGTLPSVQQAEQTLINTLLKGYDKTIRPDDQVTIGITAMLQQIVSIDEKQQIMTSSSFISQTWFDERLSWTVNDTTNISVIMLPVKNLWIPDTMILNSADTNSYLPVNDLSLASVNSEGQVYMILPALSARTRCNFNVKKFPFDKQICTINLTSWSYGSNRIAYIDNSSWVVDTSAYTAHALWTLEKVDTIVMKAIDRTAFEDTDNSVISIRLFLRRKPLFFLMNGIFACWILNCVTLLSFALPFALQITLCMTCFMTYSVYSLNFSSLFPQQSEYLMLITLYFLLSIVWTLISMAWFIFYTYISTRTEIPKILDIVSEQLRKLFSCCYSSKISKEGKKKENINAVSDESANNTTPYFIKQRKSEVVVPSAKILPSLHLKPKCQVCDRCDSCQNTIDQNKLKEINKKTIEAKCNALHNFIFLCIFAIMLFSNIALWLIISY